MTSVECKRLSDDKHAQAAIYYNNSELTVTWRMMANMDQYTASALSTVLALQVGAVTFTVMTLFRTVVQCYNDAQCVGARYCIAFIHLIYLGTSESYQYSNVIYKTFKQRVYPSGWINGERRTPTSVYRCIRSVASWDFSPISLITWRLP